MYRTLDNPYVHFELKDDILYATYIQNKVIDLEAAKQIVSERLGFTQNRKMLTIVFTEGNIDMKQPARDFLLSDKGVEGLAACALMRDSPVASVLINLFMSIHAPWPIPVKSFSRTSAALKWLRRQQ